MKNITVDRETGESIRYHGNVSYNCLGVHVICEGFVYMKTVSEMHNALFCKACGLRKLFPSTIDLTVFDRNRIWWELSEYFENAQ